jgi:hypothetical protein
MRTCLVVASVAALALALGLSASTPAAAQDYCYYSTADQLWVCPPPRPAYVGRSYARRCWTRNGRRVCRIYR